MELCSLTTLVQYLLKIIPFSPPTIDTDSRMSLPAAALNPWYMAYACNYQGSLLSARTGLPNPLQPYTIKPKDTVLDNSLKPTTCRQSTFQWGVRTFVMGIVNLSPDSFSGDDIPTLDTAVEQAKRSVEEGADIIDVGGNAQCGGEKEKS